MDSYVRTIDRTNACVMMIRPNYGFRTAATAGPTARRLSRWLLKTPGSHLTELFSHA